MAYNIHKGYISKHDSIKQKDGITTYSIELASASGTGVKNKNFYNIAHSFATDPENSDGLFKLGTLVAFAVDDKSGDGFIIAAMDKNPGRNIKVLKSEQDVSKTFDNSGSVPITAGDWIVNKLDGFIGLFYTGLVRLRAKLGTELILNPVLDMAQLDCRRFKMNLGQHGIVEFGFSEEDGKSNLNMALISDTTGLDPKSTIVHLKAGQHEDDSKVSINVIKNQPSAVPEIFQFNLDFDGTVDIATNKNKSTVKIDPEGNIISTGKSIKLELNNDHSVEIKETGECYLKTDEVFIGKGTTEQPFVRGLAMQENYDDMLDIVREHEHLVINGKAIRSFDLVELVAKKLQEGVELSDTKFID